jgi:hypothetical protein
MGYISFCFFVYRFVYAILCPSPENIPLAYKARLLVADTLCLLVRDFRLGKEPGVSYAVLCPFSVNHGGLHVDSQKE